MADRIKKLLWRISTRKRLQVKRFIIRIIEGDLKTLDVKRLRGHRDYYRTRFGDVRILFKIENKKHRIITVGFRNKKSA